MLKTQQLFSKEYEKSREEGTIKTQIIIAECSEITNSQR